MRKLAIAAALASTILATPAVAREDSWYVGVEAGAMLVEDTDLNFRDDSDVIGDVDDAITLSYKTGIDADLIAGYDFGMLRVEADLVIDYDRVFDVEDVDTIVKEKVEVRILDDHRAAFDAHIPAVVHGNGGRSERGRSKRSHNGQLPHKYPLSIAF